jgi:hypothetical protein
MRWMVSPPATPGAPGGYRNFSERHALRDDDDALTSLRVLKLRDTGEWAVRWGHPVTNRHILPADTPLEEVKAVAIALWRME